MTEPGTQGTQGSLTIDTVKPQQLAIRQEEPSVAMMLQKVIEMGITPDNVSALDKLCELYERMQTRNAEQAFAAAFVGLQAAMPSVQAIKPVPNKDGTIRYKFAPFEEIMRVVGPLLTRHGFTVAFDSEVADGRVTVKCTLTHSAGFSRTNKFACRIGGGPPGSNETQADGAAKTYAKRGVLCDALNIVIDHDTDGAANDDAKSIGATIGFERGVLLEERVDSLDCDKAAFLKFSGASRFEDIAENRVDDIERMLAKKEKQCR